MNPEKLAQIEMDAQMDAAVSDMIDQVEAQTKVVNRLQEELLSAYTKLAELQTDLEEGFGLDHDKTEEPALPEIRLDSAEDFVVKRVVEELAPIRTDWFKNGDTLHLVTILDMVLDRMKGENTYPEDLLNVTAVGVEYVKSLKAVLLSLIAPDVANNPDSVRKLADRVNKDVRRTLPQDASPLVLSFLALLSAALLKPKSG